MSEFFAVLGANIRFLHSNINDWGPLPTSLSGPAGINGDPNGRINFNSDLLSDITLHAYGQGRMGSDRNYQQIQHRIQKIILKLHLLYTDIGNAHSCLTLSHAVDQDDVAFILQNSRVQGQLFDGAAMCDASITNLQIPSHMAFINILTANYLLAGLQRLMPTSAQTASWMILARDLGYRYKRGHTRANVLQLVSTRLVPFGICAGSEHQGGKHETGLAPVQAAVNHVTTMTVNSQNSDLVNLWSNTNISVGDQLIFKLAWLPTQLYTFKHYYKGVVRQTFVAPRNCLQLVPNVFNMSCATPQEPNAPWPYDYRVHGYWRISQCFQHRASFEAHPCNVAHNINFLRGGGRHHLCPHPACGACGARSCCGARSGCAACGARTACNGCQGSGRQVWPRSGVPERSELRDASVASQQLNAACNGASGQACTQQRQEGNAHESLVRE